MHRPKLIEDMRAAVQHMLVEGHGDHSIAAALGIPPDPIEAVHAFLKSQPRRVDVIRVRFADANPTSQGIYIGAGGMGLDAVAAHLANTRFKRWPGVTRYIAGAFRAQPGDEVSPDFMLVLGQLAERGGQQLLFLVAQGGLRSRRLA